MKDLKQVEGFWDANICGKHFIDAQFASNEFFEEFSKFRYKKTHHLNKYISWEEARDKDVLEIGLGIGGDATRWAKHAKSFTGVDLTREAVKTTKIHFQREGLHGNIIQGNAEKLQLPDNTFDIVYSHGVLHHTPNMTVALKEVNRVLKDDWKLILMLYSKNSFNYWIRIQLYFRIRMLFEVISNKLGHRPKKLWNKHIQNLKHRGWSYLSWHEFPHHCTDGPGCEIANIYSKKKTIQLLCSSGFQVERMAKAHFPLGGKFPSLERFIAKFIGFHQLIWAHKLI